MSPTKASATSRLVLVRRLARVLDVPMALLSLVFVGLVIVDLASPPDAPYRGWLEQGSLAIWGVFLLEFLLKLVIAPNRFKYLKRRWFDIFLLVLPMFQVMRAFRAFRAFRTVRSLRLFSLFRFGTALRRGTRSLGRFTQTSRLGYVGATTAIVVLISAALMLYLERDATGSQIRSYGDALWWSAAIVTTVASELQPVTGFGRVLAVAMMVYGVTVFGYLVSQAVTFIQQKPPETPAKG